MKPTLVSDALSPDLGVEDSTSLSYSQGRRNKKDEQLDRRDHVATLLSNVESEVDLRTLYPRSIWCREFNSRRFVQEEAYLRSVLSSRDILTENLFVENFVLYTSIHAKQNPATFVDPRTISLECKTPGKAFYIDAWVVHPINGEKRYINFMEICDFSIGGFEDVHSTTKDSIWVQTVGTKPYNCWYQLVRPAPEYLSIWVGFIWLSDFAKYLVEYLQTGFRMNCLVSLKAFRSQFLPFLRNQHAGKLDMSFQRWYDQTAGCQDFGKHLIREGLFLRSIAATLDNSGDLLSHQIWDDIGLEYLYPTSMLERTIATDYVARGFLQAFPKWGDDEYGLLKSKALNEDLAGRRSSRRQNLNLRPFSIEYELHERPLGKPFDLSALKLSGSSLRAFLVNKVVSISSYRHQYPKEQTTAHPKDISKFALVMGFSGNDKMLRVNWLIEPVDAIMDLCQGSSQANKDEAYKVYYPWKNELYISDECSCRTVAISSVQNVYETSMLATKRIETGKFLVVNRYRKRDKAIVTANKRDLMHICRNSSCGCFSRNLEILIPSQISTGSSLIGNISLFSGCGLFDQGLEEGGNIRTIASLDNNIYAVKSIEANRNADGGHDIRHECINQWMQRLLDGHQSFTDNEKFMAATFMLSAGCSCCGWSLINPQRQNKSGQQKCSLLASVISAVEVILPQFVLLENVPAMAEHSLGCAQAVSLLAGLGYQVRVCVLQAHHYGGSTRRRRLFILAASPQLALPDTPTATHGEMISQRPVTIKDAIGHLPPVANDVCINIALPDHIPAHRWTTRLDKEISLRDIGRRIPKIPRGMGLFSSTHLFSAKQKSWFLTLGTEKKSKASTAFRRMHPDKQFSAVLTKVHSLDARGGATVHYDQDRTITLEENRIAQGVPDDWVLIGSLTEQQKQIGNAVPFVLGSAFGKVIGQSQVSSSMQNNNNNNNNNNNLPSTGEEQILVPKRTHMDSYFSVPRKFSVKRSAEVAFYERGIIDSDKTEQIQVELKFGSWNVQNRQSRQKMMFDSVQNVINNGDNRIGVGGDNDYYRSHLNTNGGRAGGRAGEADDNNDNDNEGYFLDDSSDSDVEYIGTRKLH